MHKALLSPYTKIFYIEWKLDPERYDYNVSVDHMLEGTLDINKLKMAVRRFVENNFVVNSHIETISDELHWVENSAIEELFITGPPSNEAIYDFIKRPFDLEKGPIYRFILFKCSDNRYRFIIVLHHLIIDAVSFDNIIDQISNYYNVESCAHNLTIDEQVEKLNLLYVNLTNKINATKKDSKNFWENNLTNIEPLSFNFLKSSYVPGYPISAHKESSFKNISKISARDFDIFDLDIARIRKIGLTPYLFSQIIFAILLYRYSGQERFCISYPVAIKEGADFTCGSHVNTIVIPYNFTKGICIDDVIENVKKYIHSLRAIKNNHSYLPVYEITSVSKKELLNISFIEANLRDKPYSFNNIISTYNSETKFDLSDDALFELQVVNKKIFFNVRYYVDRIDSSLLDDFICCYKNLYIEVLAYLNEPPKRIDGIIENFKIISDKQYFKIIHDWNKTKVSFQETKTIQQLFEEMADRFPENTAIRYEANRYTYQEINYKANKLAHFLINQHGIGHGSLIGICIDRNEYLIIAILAVLKTGAAYTPIAPEYPDDRVRYILNDTKSSIVLTNAPSQTRFEKVKNASVRILCLDNDFYEFVLGNESAQNPKVRCNTNDLAYVIYTSGTTGTPKGVMIQHKGVSNLVNWYIKDFQLTHKDISGQFASFGFDVFICETLPFLGVGGTIHFINEITKKSPKDLIKWLDVNNISFCELPVSLGALILHEDLPKTLSLRILKIGGEKVNTLPNKIFTFDIVNIYGPTEATVDSLFARLYTFLPIPKHHFSHMVFPPIGRPIYNMRAYILNRHNKPVPVGAIGEICVSGIGVGRGYFNNPTLTAQKFIKNPLACNEDEYLYKTGDLGRHLSDGNIEFIGRNDFQVKIRGYRIELGEIESVLNAYEGIKESVVIVRERNNGIKYLVGYYSSQAELAKEEIFKYLQEMLPDYMMPSTLIHLSAIPLTINGKLDRKSLPEPNLTDLFSYFPPHNLLEKTLCEIWGNILNLSPHEISIKDDFFRLGGNSILAIKLIYKINKELMVNVSVSDIFIATSIEKLSKLIHDINQNLSTIYPIKFESENQQVLSFSQERLWFFDQYEEGAAVYNVPLIFKLEPRTDTLIIKKCIYSIIKRHEALRTVVKEEGGKSFQCVLNTNIGEILEIPLSNTEDLTIHLKNDLNYIFNISNEIPIRVRIYNVGLERYICIVIHHIAFDGWSEDVFLQDLEQYYYHYDNGTKLELPALIVQYKDYSTWLRKFLTGDRLSTQLNFWKNKLNGYENLRLITDKLRPSQFDYNGDHLLFTVDTAVSKAIRTLAKDLGVSLYSVLLSCYYLMLRSYSNQNDIVIGTSLANRHFPEIQNLIGFFVNGVALRVIIDPAALVTDFITSISREVINAQNFQEFPFEKLVDALSVEKDLCRHPIYQVIFGMQNISGEASYCKQLFIPYQEINSLYKTAKFDISLFFDDVKENLMGYFNYATSLFNRESIERFKETYILILEQVAGLSGCKLKQENCKIKNLNYISYTQYLNITSEAFLKNNQSFDEHTISGLFEKMVKMFPEKIAVVYEGKKLTYQELNESVNKLSHYLLKVASVKQTDIVVLFLNRSELTLIAILAILKIGASYAPIDVCAPHERIKHIYNDTSSNVLLTNECFKEVHASINKNLRVIIIDDPNTKAEIKRYSSQNPFACAKPNNLAYVIYTSGTTGQPKGVLIEHRNVINYTFNIINKFKFSYNDRFLLIPDYNFDLGYTCLFGSILCGGELHILSSERLFLFDEVIAYLNKYNISVFKSSPSYFKALLERARQGLSRLTKASLKVILGGEILTSDILDALSLEYTYENLKLYNHYGPTETTIGCITTIVDYMDLSVRELFKNHSIIGKPLNNVETYILDEFLNLAPIGGVGELCIGGLCLARGYLNNENLTNERFINHPKLQENDSLLLNSNRIYRTGDLVRYHNDYQLEYIGRNDFQIKIRGYRVELSEIESTLLLHQDILQVVASVIVEGNVTKLIAYYVPKEFIPTATELRQFLENYLPSYMIPSVFIQLDKMPLTGNGKINRKALPKSENFNHTTYYPPTKYLEKKLCIIWAEILNIQFDKVSIHDSFFQLGGDSILAIRLVSKINKELSLQIKIKNIFDSTFVIL